MPHVVLANGRRRALPRILRIADEDGRERVLLRHGESEPLLEDEDVRQFFLEQDEDRRLAEGGVPEPVELRAVRRLRAIAAERRRLCGGGRP